MQIRRELKTKKRVSLQKQILHKFYIWKKKIMRVAEISPRPPPPHHFPNGPSRMIEISMKGLRSSKVNSLPTYCLFMYDSF